MQNDYSILNDFIKLGKDPCFIVNHKKLEFCCELFIIESERNKSSFNDALLGFFTFSLSSEAFLTLSLYSSISLLAALLSYNILV
jgi:hypothetical protein